MKLRIPARVAEHLLSSQAADTPESDPEMAAVLVQIRATRPRADGSRMLDVTRPDELDAIRIYVDAMAAGAEDNAHDPDGLADLNSARAVLRAMSRKTW